jgi:hypothetical protein
MMRNLKVLGLALVAVFAMSAVAASMASADELNTAANTTVTLTGKQTTTNVLKTNVGSTECEEATFTGTTVTPSSTVSVTPVYNKCKSLGFPAIIHMNGCTYLLHVGAGTTGTADLVCPAGKDVVVTANAPAPAVLKCTITVKPQTGLGTITYTNEGSGTTAAVILDLNLINIASSSTAGTGIGACPTKSDTAGTLVGSVTATADKDGTAEQVGIFLK